MVWLCRLKNGFEDLNENSFYATCLWTPRQLVKWSLWICFM